MGSCFSRTDSSTNGVSCSAEQQCAAFSRWWWTVCSQGHDTVRPRQVLIADDEAIVRDSLENLLSRRLGYSVVAVESGDQALEYLDKNLVDVLLADMIMPGIHGLDLITTVHQRHPYTDIMVMTGFTQDFPYVAVVEAGARDIIAKPHTGAELEAKLIRLFHERDMLRAQILAESKYRSIFELNRDGMVLLDCDSCTVLDANRAFCNLIGLPSEGIVGGQLTDLMQPETQQRFRSGLLLCARSGEGVLSDISFTGSNDSSLSLDISMTFILSPAEHIACLAFRDLSEMRSIEQNLADVAHRDPLTSLFNRRAFQTRIEGAMIQARNSHTPLTLMLIDVDRFKECNDSYGHETGDKVLCTLADIVNNTVRRALDQVFRWGGDEFAVLLLGADSPTAIRVSERIRASFAKTENFGTTISIGVAQFEDDMDASSLVRQADGALYRAKAMGKNVSCS